MNFQALLNSLKRPITLAVTTILLVQAGLFYAIPKSEQIPLSAPLASFPGLVGSWRMIEQTPIDPETANLLKADDTVSRSYYSPEHGTGGTLFIAWYRSQRQGVSPHSPKVCLPGSGWSPVDSEIVNVKLPGLAEPQPINRYTVVKGNNKSIVMYWYQSHGRVDADEYKAKAFSMLDSIRYGRSDTSMIRLVVPTMGDEARGRQQTLAFLQEVFPAVWNFLPGKELHR